MNARDLKEQVYGDFISWLNRSGIEDRCFSMDVWMSKTFDALYNQYKREREMETQTMRVFQNTPIEVLEDIVTKRKEVEKAQKKSEKPLILVPGKDGMQ